MICIVGRDLVPVVGMKVCEIRGGFGPAKREEDIETDFRTGTISKADAGPSDVTFAQLMKTGLGGNFELALSPEDPSHPDNMPASPRVAAPCHPAILACGADAQAQDKDDDESSSVPTAVTAVSLDGPQHKDAAVSQGSDQARSMQESAAPALPQTIERGNKNIAKLRATVKAVTVAYEFAARTNTRIQARKSRQAGDTYGQ